MQPDEGAAEQRRAKVICEEARLNPDAQKFVTGNGYQIRSGQEQAAQKGTNIQFPRTAVEIKADWIPASDFAQPGFSCSSPQTAVYTEMIDGTCYALAGLHISSKLWPNWIWATFEPQNPQTNPNRCVAFGPCHDKWGATPSTSTGGNTTLTQPLNELMTQANLPAALRNYRMDGVQIAFGTKQNPTLLGNSVIEGENVGMQKGTASCITCHSVSTIQTDGTDGIKLIDNQVGPKFVPPKGWIARDFVWSLALACPKGIQACAPAK